MVAFMGLPMMILGFTFFLGFGLGNVGLILLFLGQITVAPAATYLLQFLLQGVSRLPNYDVCNLVPSAAARGGMVPVAPTFWMAQFLFFIGYLLENAYSLYTQVADPEASEVKVQNRKEQALTAIIVTSLIAVVIVALRYKLTGCESFVGILVASLTLLPLGVGWYQFAASCGIRSADVFGISAKILPIGATAPPPQVCVPSKA
jgi:hypothetical protein